MTAKILLLEIQPRNTATGARQTVRFAGGGANFPYRYGGQDWRAGLAILPIIGAQLDFDGKELGLGAVPQALQLEWAPSDKTLLNAMASLHWKDAPFTLYMGDENAAGTLPGALVTGKCMAHKVTSSTLQLAMADPATDLQRPILTATFAGTGGLEGPTEWAGRRKRRVWGQVFNIEGEPIDPANNVYCFGDPSRPWQSFDQVRDKGAEAAATTTLAWQGSVTATFTALKAASVPAGGGVICPSIAMVKWWTRPAGLLCADVKGENTGGYVETAAGIVNAILAARAGPALASGVLAATNAIRPDACGYVADDLQVTIGAAMDWILGGVSLLWVLNGAGGTIRIEPWAFTASVGTFRSDHTDRIKAFPPLKSRRVGYRRNYRVHSAGELAAIVTYGDGTPIEDYRPAEAGATAGATIGTDLRLTGGTIPPRANIVTPEGISLGFANQGALSILNTVNGGVIDPGTVTNYNMSAAPGNLIQNPDFATGDFTGWRPYSSPAQISVVPRTDPGVPANAPTDFVAKYARTASPGGVSTFAATKAYSDNGANKDGFAVTGGDTIRVAVNVAKGAGLVSDDFSVRAYFYKSDGTYTDNRIGLSVPFASIPSAWGDPFTGTFNVPAGALRCWLYVYLASQSAGELFWTNLFAARVNQENDLAATAVRLGTNVVRADGTTSVTDAAAITAIGTALGIANQGALAVLNSAPWATNVSGRPAELTDGRITTAIRSGGELQGGLWGGAASVPIVQLLEAALVGKSLAIDPDFSKGVIPSSFQAYGANTTRTIVADDTAPNGSGYILRVGYTGGGSSPGFGGFVQTLTISPNGLSRPGYYAKNTKLALIYRAKIPVGRSIAHASNATGTGATATWITPTAGTGNWETYILIRTVTDAGTFSTTGHTYITGGADAAFTWDVAYYDQRELASTAMPTLARLLTSAGALATDADLVTNQGIAASINNQSPIAAGNSLTTGQVTNSLITISAAGALSGAGGGSVTITGLGYLGALNATFGARAGTSIYRTDGTTIMTQVELRTAEGISLGFVNQAAIATDSTASARLLGAIRSASSALPRTFDLRNYETSVGSGALPSTNLKDNLSSVAYIEHANGRGVDIDSTINPAALQIGALVDFPVVDGVIYEFETDFEILDHGANGQANVYFYYRVLDKDFTLLTNVTGTGAVNLNTGAKRHLTNRVGYNATAGTVDTNISTANAAFIRVLLLVNRGPGTASNAGAKIRITNFSQTSDLFTGKSITLFGDRLAGNFTYTGGATVQSLQPAQVGANVTGTNIALGFANQGALAILNTISGSLIDASSITNYNLAQSPGNLIQNPDFATGDFTGYTMYNTPGAQSVVAKNAANVPASAPSNFVAQHSNVGASASVGTFAATKAYSAVGADKDGFSVVPGDTYRVAIEATKMASAAFTTFNVQAYFLKNDGTYTTAVTPITVAAASVATAWGAGARLSGTFVAPAGALRCWLYVLTGSMTAGKVFWTNLFASRVNRVDDLLSNAVRIGTNIVRADGSTAVNEALIVTALGIAASIINQGALAIKNAVDLSTGDVLPRGSIPVIVPDNGFTYTSTTTTVTINWPSMTLYRSDGTTITVASGSQAITGLSATSQYKVYPYVADTGGTSGTISFVASASSPSYGSPSILYPQAGSVAARAQANLINRIDMNAFGVATPSGGSGGGGGGGWGCVHEDMLVRNGRAGELAVGDTVDTPDGTATVDRIMHTTCSRWIEVWDGPDMLAKVTERHLFYRATDGAEVMAKDVRLGDLLKGADGHLEVTGLRLCTRPATAVGIGITDPHLHFLGQRRILCHNGTAKP